MDVYPRRHRKTIGDQCPPLLSFGMQRDLRGAKKLERPKSRMTWHILKIASTRVSKSLVSSWPSCRLSTLTSILSPGNPQVQLRARACLFILEPRDSTETTSILDISLANSSIFILRDKAQRPSLDLPENLLSFARSAESPLCPN